MTDLEQKQIFSANLSSLLTARHLTQREVANSIGVSAQTFNTWCRGVAIPRMDKIQKLADYFHVEKSVLIDPPDSSASHSLQLTTPELILLNSYRKLDADDKSQLDSFIGYLLSNEKYIKTNAQTSVETA